MTKPFPFSEARIRALKPPAAGRVYVKDTKLPGLQLCITSAGSRTFYFVRRIEGKPTRVRLGTAEQLSVEAARKAAAAVTGTIASGKNPQTERREKRQEPTIGHLWAQWELHCQAHKRPKSVYEDRLKYNKFLKPWATRRLSTIRKGDVQELHARIGRENGPYQANRVLALLRSMFNKADTLGYRGDNPCRGIKAFKEQSRDRFLHPDELAAFFAALNSEPDARDFYVTLLLSGARRGNVQAMKWDDLDLHGGYWRIPGDVAKGGIPIIVPLVAPLVAILSDRRARANGSPWVFPGRKGKHMANPKGAWGRILTRAGLDNLHPHDLRRSLGSYMAGQNTSLTIIGRALGHRTPQATAVYARLAMDPIKAAVEKATTTMLTIGGQQALLAAPRKEGDGNGQG